MEIKNYAACFVDLLGQKSALLGQGLIPDSKDCDVYQTYENSVKNSVGHIKQLHENTDLFFQQYHNDENEPTNRLLAEQIEAIKKATSTKQRWSDGMVAYTSIESNHKKLSMIAVHEIFMYAGIFCFIGLAQRQPLRGGLEFSWGWERNNCEIYGAVVANAYAEEKKAQLGRISVGPICVAYLREALLAEPADEYHDANQKCAKSCLEMLDKENNEFFIDYLGVKFYETFFSLNPSAWREQYQLATDFIKEQLFLHGSNGCTKLSERYRKLLEYFECHKLNFV